MRATPRNTRAHPTIDQVEGVVAITSPITIVRLRDLGLRMPVNDSWIAATALALGVPVVTQDDDYVAVPGLEVIHV